MKLQARNRRPTAALSESRNAFDDLYEEISHDWEQKARALQERRWRKLDQDSSL